MTSDKFPVLKLSNKSSQVLRGEVKVFHKKHLMEAKKELKAPTNIENIMENFDPDLFESLRELRYELASEKQIAPFMIFHDSSLREMASFFPRDKDSFLTIKGVALKKYESYGEDFLKVIREYLKEKGEVSSDLGKKEIIRETLDERYENTYNAYLQGLTLEEIAKKRNFTPSTILEHLSKCQEKGKHVDWTKFILDTDIENQIIDKAKELGTEKLKAIKDELSDGISYEYIKLVILKNNL